MNISIRTDASILIGSGHVMRCLTRAQELRNRGHNIQFICAENSGHMGKTINEKEFDLVLLPELNNLHAYSDGLEDEESFARLREVKDAKETSRALCPSNPDWVIVDHYELGAVWHAYMYKYCNNIMVIDDLANRLYDCDILLDQTYKRKVSEYKNLVSSSCKIYTGPNYGLLRSEFLNLRKKSFEYRKSSSGVRNILVSMGGMDPDNVTENILNGLLLVNWPNTVNVNVVLGDRAPHIKTIRKFKSSGLIKMNVITNTSNMATLMLNSDLAFGAGGTTTWERCCLGLPTFLVISATNQVDIVNNLCRDGVTINLGWYSDLEPKNIKNTVDKIFSNTLTMLTMTKKSFKVCDGRGVKRVADIIVQNDI